MNLILLSETDFIDPFHVRLEGRRFNHIRNVVRASLGDTLTVGLQNGAIGSGEVTALSSVGLDLKVVLDQPPPTALPMTLILALPRPKMLKRLLQSVTALGVKRLYLLNSYRVEKSFWGSPLLQPEALHAHLVLGLEQARDTVVPEIHLRPRFKPFVEDELPAIAQKTHAVVAHPASEKHLPVAKAQPVTLAVGPEGGFIDYEIQKLQQIGFEPMSLGPRILRVETAVPVLISTLS